MLRIWSYPLAFFLVPMHLYFMPEKHFVPLGGIEPLVRLLDSKLEHVLVNCVNALRVLCDGNHSNQTAVAQIGAVAILTELLSKLF